jgi:hypothetical protein
MNNMSVSGSSSETQSHPVEIYNYACHMCSINIRVIHIVCINVYEYIFYLWTDLHEV